jgi:hypothetical protein
LLELGVESLGDRSHAKEKRRAPKRSKHGLCALSEDWPVVVLRRPNQPTGICVRVWHSTFAVVI